MPVADRSLRSAGGLCGVQRGDFGGGHWVVADGDVVDLAAEEGVGVAVEQVAAEGEGPGGPPAGGVGVGSGEVAVDVEAVPVDSPPARRSW
jgi:hypothetical protein